MSKTSRLSGKPGSSRTGWWLLLAAMLLTIAVYSSGLYGGYLFDDYPNIVDNHGVQPHDASVPTLVRAALSSPSSEFKRPLASLSFAVNYLTTGLDPYWMKLTNLVIHLLNGLLVFLLARALLLSVGRAPPASFYGGGSDAERRAVPALPSAVPKGRPLEVPLVRPCDPRLVSWCVLGSVKEVCDHLFVAEPRPDAVDLAVVGRALVDFNLRGVFR